MTTRRPLAAGLMKRTRIPAEHPAIGRTVTVTTEHGSQTGTLAQLEAHDDGRQRVTLVTETGGSRYGWSGVVAVGAVTAS